MLSDNSSIFLSSFTWNGWFGNGWRLPISISQIPLFVSSFVPNNASSGCKEMGVALFLDGIFQHLLRHSPISFCSFAFRIIRENTLSFSDCFLHSYRKWNIIIKDMNLTSIYISEKFHIIPSIIRMSIDHALCGAVPRRVQWRTAAPCAAQHPPGRYLPHRAGRPRKAARMEKIRFSHLHRLQRQVQKRRTADEILIFSGIPPIYTRGIRKPQMPLVTYQSAIYSVPVFT